MEEKLDIKQLKALSKEKRMVLAAEIRKDPDLYNAVNGMGGLSEKAPYGLLQGTITEKGIALSRVEVIAVGKERIEVKATTNQYGYYKMNLNEAAYTVYIVKDGSKAATEVEIFNGKTATYDFDFEKIKELEELNAAEKVTDTTEESTNTEQ